jgi:hypothetical protein
MQNIKQTGRFNEKAYIYATPFKFAILLIVYMLYILILFINKGSRLRSNGLLS